MPYLNANYLSYYQTLVQGIRDRDVFVISTGKYWDLSEPFFTNRKYGREDWQLLCVTKGSGKILIHDEWKKMTVGDCMLFSPGDCQQYIFGGEDLPEYFYLHFCGKRIPTLIQEIGVPVGLFHVKNTAPLVSILNHIMKEIQFKSTISQYYLEARLLQLFVMIARDNDKTKMTRDPRVEQIISFMNANISKKLTTKDYSDLIHVSGNYLIRLFTTSIGIPPGDYFMNLKMNAAASILESTDLSVSEVSDSFGFSDPLYFSRTFRKHIGVSPSEFRKNQKET